MTVPIEAQVECVQRELRYRAHVYPRLIAKGRLTPAKAKAETEAMEAVLATLQSIEEEERLL